MTMAEYQMVEVSSQNGCVIAAIKEPQLSTSVSAEMLENELTHLIQQLRPQRVVLDFEQVRLISSSTIGVLFKINRRLRESGGQLRLCCVSVPIAEVCRTLNLQSAGLLVFDTLEQALQAEVVESDAVREVWED
jgi:anti-anti-sigma factor